MPVANERTALLGEYQNGNDSRNDIDRDQEERPKPFVRRVLASIRGREDEPTWLASYRFLVLCSRLNVLLVFIPFSFLSGILEWDAALRFGFSFLALISLAKVLGETTDQLSHKVGQTLCGLLNASFGNAIEIIVGLAALLKNEFHVVQTSLLGSILSKLLLVLGCSFVAGGLKFSESNFQVTAAQNAASLMTLSCITLIIPAAYKMSIGESEDGLLFISRGTALILLFVYAAYLVFQLKTHAFLFDEGLPMWGQEIEEEEAEVNKMSVPAAASGLLLVTVIASFCADYLVGSIEEVAERYQIPKAFIGLILLSIVANTQELVTSVSMAMKDKMEVANALCIGSSIQIAAFVIPLLVIVGWFTGHPLTLMFGDFETIVLFVSVILVTLLIMDGKSNYMEGLMLLALYLIFAVAMWVS